MPKGSCELRDPPWCHPCRVFILHAPGGSAVETNERISKFVSRLIADGEAILGTEWQKIDDLIGGTGERFVDLQKFKQWRASCNLLVSLMGDLSDPWKEYLSGDSGNRSENAISMQGALKAIRAAIDDDLLVSFEDLVFAEAFSNLLDQAEYLFDQGYFLASGVILRAVLEERLRRLCDRHSSMPTKVRPTISDFNMALYKAKVYNKLIFKNVDDMAAIGNAAAHNDPDLKRDDVERMKRDLPDFLTKFSA